MSNTAGAIEAARFRSRNQQKDHTMSKAIRQGDIMIVPCKSIPASATPVEPINDRLIVALGEATGHHHSFPHRRGVTLFRDDGAGGALYVRADAAVALEHQEHGALVIDKGTHRVIRQRTFAAGMVRQVAD